MKSLGRRFTQKYLTTAALLKNPILSFYEDRLSLGTKRQIANRKVSNNDFNVILPTFRVTVIYLLFWAKMNK